MNIQKHSCTQRQRVIAVTIIFALTVLFIPTNSVRAAAGDLDPSFGVGGKVTTDVVAVSPTFEMAEDVVIQPDGKIVAVGSVFFNFSSGFDFIAARYNADGTLDTNFGSGGIANADIGFFDQGISVALQNDGKIIVGGSASVEGNAEDFALVRFNSDGSLDTSFGSGGKVTTDFFGLGDHAFSVAVQSDGKIVLAGFSFFKALGSVIALARYNSDGSLDASFGNGGRVTTSVFGTSDQALAMVIQPDGKIVVGGSSFNPVVGSHFTLVRYNTDGNPDVTFGIGGIVFTDSPMTTLRIHSLALQTDGKIVAAGDGADFLADTRVPALARYHTNGNLDTSFGSGGVVLVSPGDNTEVRDLAIQQNGKIVAAIWPQSFIITGSDFSLLRYNTDGILDPTFGTGGKVRTDFSGNRDISLAVAIQSDGKIVAAGFTFPLDNENGQMALARYEGDSVEVTPFDICLQDDSSDSRLQFNSTTGDYQFTSCGGFTTGGTGALIRKGSVITLGHNAPDRRVTARIDTAVNRATASVQMLSQGVTFTISDRNTFNNTCACR